MNQIFDTMSFSLLTVPAWFMSSTKTFNLLFVLKLDADLRDNIKFWWNGKMVLVYTEKEDDQRIYSTFDIDITEKENQISDTESMSKEQVGLCANVFRCENNGEMGYNFLFSPDGIYICEEYYTMDESEAMERAVIGGYEVIGNNKVRIYPYFAEFPNPYFSIKKDYSNFSRFNLLPEQKGFDATIVKKASQYNIFGNIYLYDTSSRFIGSTNDWDISYGSYGVHDEEAASFYNEK